MKKVTTSPSTVSISENSIAKGYEHLEIESSSMKKVITPFSTTSISGNPATKVYGNLEIEIPQATPEQLEQVVADLKQKITEVHQRPIDYYVDLLCEAGKRWRDPEYQFRKEAMQLLPLITNQSNALVNREISLITDFLQRMPLEWILHEELGGKKHLDEWVDHGPLFLHRQPYGLVFHNLSGNAIIVPPLSAAMGLLTKNVNLLKVSGDEPYFGIAFAESLRDIDPQIEEELAVLYWPGENQELYDSLFRAGIDAVVHWGSENSRQSIAAMARQYGVKVIEHGPKVSFEVIESPSVEESEKLAHNVAVDIAEWDQNACLSPRFVFVKDGELTAKQFTQVLASSMDDVERELPKGNNSARQAADILSKRENYLLDFALNGGGEVFASQGTKWTVFYSERKPEQKDISACFGRTIFLVPIADLTEVVDFITTMHLKPYLQVMGYNGDDTKFMDAVTFNGVSLITKPGQMGIHSPGAPHDGFFNLDQLTFIVSHQKKMTT